MNKLIFILIIIISFSHCSFNENSKIWKENDKKLKKEKNTKNIFAQEKKIISEFNKGLILDLSEFKTDNIDNNLNNFGSQSYKGELKKIGYFNFSKLKEINNLDFKPNFLKDGLVFFDKRGSILRYGSNQKIIWEKNYYSKAEKKLNPKLNFLVDNQNILVTDSIAKYYSLNLNTGELNWSKNSIYPFNSEIKKYKDKIFVVDYNNTLRCYKIVDGTECWNLQTEDSFAISSIKYSLIIINDTVIFSNSLGDITAVDIETGLISWQLPTQNSSIINEAYTFRISKLVSDGKSIFFSNNKNEFYSIDFKTGTNNWMNEINSNIKPILIGNLIFTISSEGYLYVIEKNNGNIIRVTDLFINYKTKKRKNIFPVGFSIGNKNLYLTNSDGKMIIASLDSGSVTKVQKVSSGLVSEPFIFNKNLFILRNGSIVKYN